MKYQKAHDKSLCTYILEVWYERYSCPKIETVENLEICRLQLNYQNSIYLKLLFVHVYDLFYITLNEFNIFPFEFRIINLNTQK